MNLSSETKQAVQIAQAFVKEYKQNAIAPPHLLLGLLHNDVGLGAWLTAMGKDVYFIRDWAEYRLEMMPRSGRVDELPSADASVQQVMKLADLIALQAEAMAVFAGRESRISIRCTAGPKLIERNGQFGG